MSTTTKESIIINLNSADGVQNNASYLSNVIFNFKGILREDSKIEYSTVSLLHAEICSSFYNINYTCNILKYNYNGGATQTLTIPVGNYSAFSLSNELTSLFGANSQTFTISISNSTGLLTFSSSSPFEFFVNGSTIYSVLGMGSSNLLSSSNIIICPLPLSLIGISRIKVSSTRLHTKGFDSNNLGAVTIIATIPVNVSSWQQISYLAQNNNECRLTESHINSIDIQLYDQNGNFVNFNGVNWSMTLQLNIYTKTADDKNNAQIIKLLQSINNTLANNQNQNQNQNSENQTNDNYIPTESDLGILPLDTLGFLQNDFEL